MQRGYGSSPFCQITLNACSPQCSADNSIVVMQISTVMLPSVTLGGA